MKKNLKKVAEEELFHFVDGVRKEGPHSKLEGNCSNLKGDCSNLRGNCSNLEGNLDECDITPEERSKGIKIEDLVG